MNDLVKLKQIILEVRRLIEPLTVSEMGVVAMDVLKTQGDKAGLSMEVMAWGLAETLRRQQD